MVGSELFSEMVRRSHNGGNAIRIGQVMGKRPADVDFSKKVKPQKQQSKTALQPFRGNERNRLFF